jgi:hypothetical protein
MKKSLLLLVCAMLATVFATNAQVIYQSDFSKNADGWKANKGEWAIQDNPVIPEQAKHYGFAEGAGINGDGGASLSEDNKPIMAIYDAKSFENYKATAVLYPKWGNLFGLVFNYVDKDNFWVLELASRDKDAWIKQVKNGDFVGTYKWMPRDADLETYSKFYADTLKGALWIENDVNPLTNFWTIEVSCNEFAETSISVNGQVIFDKIDAGEKGKIGLWQNWCPVFAKSIKVEDLGTTAYESDFSKDAKGWVANKGDWKVQDNPVIPSQPKHYGFAEGAGINGDGGASLSEDNKPIMTIYDAKSFENYRATAVLYPKWGNLFGVVFNYTDKDNYWVLEIASKDKDAWIKQVKNGDFVGTYKWMPRDADQPTYSKEYADTIMNAFWIENDVDADQNFWTVDIVCNEFEETTISINGSVIFENIDAGAKGKIGIWQNWCPVFVKSVVVRTLGADSGVGVNNFANNNYSLYPNPVAHGSVLNINTKQAKESTVDVFDFTGRKVYTQKTQNGSNISIETSNLKAKGMYFVTINNVETHKLVVK